MNNHVIGIQISNFRKKAGLTQEELGEAVGISGQAVSRWECGGAPDITLLPAIADTLGVTIDALFGRAGNEHVEIEDALGDWHYAGYPCGRLIICYALAGTEGRLCRMACAQRGIPPSV